MLTRKYEELKVDWAVGVVEFSEPAFFRPITALIPCPIAPRMPQVNIALSACDPATNTGASAILASLSKGKIIFRKSSSKINFYKSVDFGIYRNSITNKNRNKLVNKCKNN
jgi:hypothetical protein